MTALPRVILLVLLAVLLLAKPALKKTAVLEVKQLDLQMGQSITFNITNLAPEKAFMINLKQPGAAPHFAKFQLTIKGQDTAQDCAFEYSHNLCVIAKPPKELTATVTCKDKACRNSIMFSQRALVLVGEASDYKSKLTVPGEIYQLAPRKFNTILEVYSEKDEYAVLAEEVVVFSNVHAFPLQQTQELDANSAIFGLKPISQGQQQFIFIESDSNKQEPLRLSFKSHRAQLRDAISIVDFIENFGKHSHNNYIFVGKFQKNLQAKVRVFSPRDPKGIPLTFSVRGREGEGKEEKLIRELKFSPVDFGEHKFFDFTFAITKAVLSPYKLISFQLLLDHVEDKSIFFEITVSDVDTFQTSIFEHVYFGSKADEVLRIQVEPQVKLQLSTGDKDIQILTKAEEKYFSSIESCSLHRGCSIEISTKSECMSCSFSFELKDEDVKNHVLYYEVKGDSIEGRVDFEEEIFFKYSMNGNSSTEIVVNSMNVVLYANFITYQRCAIPSAACHQYAINQQNPMIVHNQEDKPVDLVLGVFGLDKTAFKVRFLNEGEGLEVKLGEKFSYLMDDEEKELELKFVVEEGDTKSQEHLHFSLLAPLHALSLSVTNDEGQTIQSLQGYITFERQAIHSNLFTIRVKKTTQYLAQFIHFTLLVSSSDITLRLDPTITHYEKYLPKTNKTFLIEYDSSQANALNIYTENLQKEKTTLTLRISEPIKVDGEKPKLLAEHKLARDYEFIDLDADLEAAEACEDNCELEITIVNEGNASLEQSLTMLVEESVMALEDSIWTVFEINDLTRSSHFYFVPRNQDKPINILFSTDDAFLSLDYRIYDTQHSLNPQNWPFPNNAEPRTPSSSQEITIPADNADLADCWPNCVVLLSLHASDDDREEGVERSVVKSYKILASNNVLELLEDTKLELTLQNEEEKVLFIQASGAIKHDKLTFFTYYSAGRARITASLVSNDKEYRLYGQKDFLFEELETVLPTYLISGIINNEFLEAEASLLKITVHAITTTKLTLEYSSVLREVYRLRMDDLEVATLPKGGQILYDFLPERDFTLKLYRIKGFPLFKVFKCAEQNYTDCLTDHRKLIQEGTLDFLQTEDRVKDENLAKEEPIVENIASAGNYPFEVFVEKSYEFEDEECERCVYFLWIYCFEGDLELSINIHTANSETELKEMHVLNGRADFKQHNRYLLNVARDKDTILTLNVLEGAARVVISDTAGPIASNDLNSIDNSFKDFTIEADLDEDDDDEEEEEKEEEENSEMAMLRKPQEENRLFRRVHVTVSCLSEGPVEYVISYSVGSSSLYLEDGVLVQKNLVPSIPHTFLYRNRNRKHHAYLTLSWTVSHDHDEQQQQQGEQGEQQQEEGEEQGERRAGSLGVKFYYYPDASNRSVKETFKPELPPQRNENYLGATLTHVYELPSKFELYEMDLQSQGYVRVTASINHQELVYLPVGFEYLIKLHAGEMLNLAVDSPASEYLEVRVRKCSQGTPTLMYTNDAQEFKRGLFEAEVDIDATTFKQYIKTKKNSKSLHLRFIGPEDDDSLLTVSVAASSRALKQKAAGYKAGNRGLIDYRIIETSTVEVWFSPASCGGRCEANFQYFLAVSESIEQIYGELNCANSYFVPQAAQLVAQAKAELIPVTEKHFHRESGTYRQRIKLTGKQAFIGVKAVDGKEEVMYLPVEVRSFWSELGRASVSVLAISCMVVAVVLLLVIAVSTKLARRGYRPISAQE